MKRPRHILITGASSGIGRALAESYASPDALLALCGRNDVRLKEVGAICRNLGAKVVTKAIDVLDRDALAEWITECDRNTPLDLVIANAGISAGTGTCAAEQETQVRQVFDINITGVINTIHPIINPMRARKCGQIAIVSSIAAFRGTPSAPAYCASKAAVKVYGEGLRGQLRHEGIEVNVICPGFVKSRITDTNTFPMPFLMEASLAAKIIKRGLASNKGRIVFPWPMHFLVWILTVIPSSWSDRLLSRLPKKN